MSEQRIFHLPYWYEASVIKRRCRITETVLLRSVAPVSILCLDSSEAPVGLDASLEFPEFRSEQSVRLILRRDAVGYLRPLTERTQGEKSFFTDADLDGLANSYGPNVEEGGLPLRVLTRSTYQLNKDHEIEFVGGIRLWRRPEDVPTAEGFAPEVRQWVSDPKDEAEQDLAQAMANFVLVDGVLHRRVPAPAWCFHRTGENPELVNGENIEEVKKTRGLDGIWWPITRVDDFISYTNEHGKWKNQYAGAVEAPFEKAVVDQEIVESAKTILPELAKWVEHALADFSDDGLEAYKRFRAAVAVGVAGDATGCRAAFRELRVMADDGGFAPRDATDLIEVMRSHVLPHLQNWENSMVRLGLDEMRPEDEAAVQAMSV